MTTMSNAPAHRAEWRKPIAYSASMADPKPWPRPVVLRSSCGHALGVGIVGKRQRFIAVRRCAR